MQIGAQACIAHEGGQQPEKHGPVPQQQLHACILHRGAVQLRQLARPEHAHPRQGMDHCHQDQNHRNPIAHAAPLNVFLIAMCRL